MKPKPTLGQTLYRIGTQRWQGLKLTAVTVTKVGRKYFTVDCGGYKTEHLIESWVERSDYSGGYQLYESEQVYADEIERSRLFTKIKTHGIPQYSPGKLTLEQLRAIAKIIWPEGEA